MGFSHQCPPLPPTDVAMSCLFRCVWEHAAQGLSILCISTHPFYWQEPIGSRTCLFPRSAVINCHKLGILKASEIYSFTVLRARSFDVKVSVGLVPSGGSRWESIAASLLASGLPAILGVPWFIDESFQSLGLYSHDIIPCVSLCLQISLSLQEHCLLDLGPILIQCDLICTWLHL